MTKVQVPLWDNARFMAIVFVLLGHSLTKVVPDTPGAFALYVTIYLCHIFLFVFLFGYFSSADVPSAARVPSVVVDLVPPYLLLEIIWSAIHSIQAGPGLSSGPLLVVDTLLEGEDFSLGCEVTPQGVGGLTL